MKKRIPSFILFITILAGGLNLECVALAQEDVADVVVERPQIKYKSSLLRDPFSTYLVKELKTEVSSPVGKELLATPGIDLDSLKVQGIVWGGEMPQAIINNEVLSVGDVINGAKIISIDKKGINFDSSGEVVSLSVPGVNSEAKQKANQVIP